MLPCVAEDQLQFPRTAVVRKEGPVVRPSLGTATGPSFLPLPAIYNIYGRFWVRVEWRVVVGWEGKGQDFAKDWVTNPLSAATWLSYLGFENKFIIQSIIVE